MRSRAKKRRASCAIEPNDATGVGGAKEGQDNEAYCDCTGRDHDPDMNERLNPGQKRTLRTPVLK